MPAIQPSSEVKNSSGITRREFLRLCALAGGAALVWIEGLGLMALKNWLFGKKEPPPAQAATTAPAVLKNEVESTIIGFQEHAVHEANKARERSMQNVSILVRTDKQAPTVTVDAEKLMPARSIAGFLATILAAKDVDSNKMPFNEFKANFGPLLINEAGLAYCLEKAAGNSNYGPIIVEKFRAMGIDGVNYKDNVLHICARALTSVAIELNNLKPDTRNYVLSCMAQKKGGDRFGRFKAMFQFLGKVTAGEVIGNGPFTTVRSSDKNPPNDRQRHSLVIIRDREADRNVVIVIMTEAKSLPDVDLAKATADLNKLGDAVYIDAVCSAGIKVMRKNESNK